MVKIDKEQIWVTVNYTVNLGKYEFIKLEAGLSKTYEKGEDPLISIGELADEVLELITTKGEDAREMLTPEKEED